MSKFWMVVNVRDRHDNGEEPGPIGEVIPRDDAPRYLHETRAGAEREALRLAKKLGDRGELVVLEAVLEAVTAASDSRVFRLEPIARVPGIDPCAGF